MGRFWVISRSVPILGFCILLLGGCGRGSMVGRQYDDFTAYYNKFYNARQAFEDGLEAIEKTEPSVDRTVYLSVFPVPEASGGASSFEEAVRKSAGVLRKHPNSRWVDDALLLIGKSYFYQGNFAGATQKFREVMTLEEGRKQEARFWLARTLLANDRLLEVEKVLQTVAATEAPDDPWTARLQLVRGQLRVQREQWAAAASALERGLAGDVPDRPGARASFLFGQVHQTLGHPEKARAAYRAVQRYDPRYELGFAARLSAIELQGRYGDAEEALDRLRNLQKDDKNLEKRGVMARVEARIYRAQNRDKQARTVLRQVLYDDRDKSLPSTDRARVHYELGLLYRDAFEDFSRAAAHFDTASTGLSESTSEEISSGQRLPSAPTDAQAQARQYKTLAERSQEVARLDSLLRIGRMSPAEYNAFVEKLRRRRLQAAERQQEQERTRRLRTRGDRQTNRKVATATEGSGAGFLFYKDPARVQQGKQRFREIWGDRPRVDNWRRRNAMRASQETETADTSTEPSASSTESTAQSASLNLSDIPRDSASQAKMEDRLALARYELGNSLLLAAEHPDSAATWYQRVLQESGDHPVAKRALYALAEARRIQGDTLAARSVYERLVEQYPRTSLARRARQRLGQSPKRERTNRSSLADSLYAGAYEQWKGGCPRAALKQFLTVADQYPDTKAAPRALFASAVVYWKQVQAGAGSAPQALVDQYLGRDRVRETTAVDSSGADTSRAARQDTSSVPADTTRQSGPQLPTSPNASTEEASTSASTPAAEASDRPKASSTVQDSTAQGRAAQKTPADAVQSVPDSTTADSVRTPAPTDALPSLVALLRHLAEQYPDAPQVKRAQSLRTMIEERKQNPSATSGDADTAATGAARPSPPTTPTQTVSDSTQADSVRRPAAPQRPDSSTQGAAPEEQAPLPAPTDP